MGEMKNTPLSQIDDRARVLLFAKKEKRGEKKERGKGKDRVMHLLKREVNPSSTKREKGGGVGSPRREGKVLAFARG